MIEIIRALPDEISISRSEVFRYLGYGKNSVDEGIRDLVEKCIGEMQPRLSCKACCDMFAVRSNDDGDLDLGFAMVRSENLKKNLVGCDEIILFAATIGFEADRIIQKYSAVSPVNAVVAQAIGATAIERWCDILCEHFAQRELNRGRYLRPRFSPGYGDFPLELQKNIISVLNCGRMIGITLTDGLLMSPSKSVSAVVGVSRNNTHCNHGGCEVCVNVECEFRRS